MADQASDEVNPVLEFESELYGFKLPILRLGPIPPPKLELPVLPDPSERAELFAFNPINGFGPPPLELVVLPVL